MKKDTICIIFLLIASLAWFGALYILSSHPNDIDSYYYLLYAKDKKIDYTPGFLLPLMVQISLSATIFILYALAVGSVILVYLISRKLTTELPAFLAALLFCLDAFSGFNMNPALLDKNVMIIFLFLLMIYSLASNMTAIVCYLIVILIFILSACVWEGWTIFLIIFTLSGIILFFIRKDYLVLKKWKIIGIGAIILIPAIIYSRNFIKLFTWNVAELRPAFFFFSPAFCFYVFGLIIIFYWYKYQKKTHKDKVIISFLIVTAFLLLAVFRFNIFFVPCLYIAISLPLSILLKSKITRSILLFFALFSLTMLLSYPMYLRQNYATPDLINAITYANSMNKSCLFTDWGKGHIYQYYFNGEVINKGHPTNINEIRDFYQHAIMSRDCVYMFENRDLNIYIEKYNKSMIYPIEMHHNINFGNYSVVIK